MRGDDNAGDQAARGSPVARAFRRVFLFASAIAFVLMIGLVILYVLALVALSGCGAAGGC